jgi:hypothetical protein
MNQLLKTCNLKINQLTSIGVYAGPASYTRLRVHITTANTLAWVLHLPVFTLHPGDKLPEAVPERMIEGKVNLPIEPVYGAIIG